MPKKESDNYKIVSSIAVLLLCCAMIGLTLAGLSHAFNIAGNPGSSDEGYVIDTSAPQ